jgi:hypothetical protein
MKLFSVKFLGPVLCLLATHLAASPVPAEGGGQGLVKVKTKEYLIKAVVPSKAAPGKEASVRLTIQPVAPWKMNDVSSDGKKFPFSVELTPAEGIQLAKEKLKRADAETVSKAKVVFNIPFTAERAGTFELKMAVDLSVCKSGSCHSYWGSKAPTFKVKIHVKRPEKSVEVKSEKDGYVVRVTFPETLETGKQERLKVSIAVLEPARLDTGFAFKVMVPKVEGITFDQKEYAASGASEEAADFEIPFTVKKAGESSLQLKVRLSITPAPKKKKIKKTAIVKLALKAS